jgi:drug/metabolite transporter (DMT)-like permease
VFLLVKDCWLNMEWYIFALLAPAFWAMNNVFIKFLITKKYKSYFPMIFTVILMDAIFALAIAAFSSISVIFPYSIIAFLIGLMPLLSFWFYLHALAKEEVTRITTLFQLIPVFVVFISAIFLNEILGAQKYFGIALIVTASILISYKKSEAKSVSRTLKFMIPFGIIIATYTVMDKILLGYLDFLSVFFWNVIGTSVGALCLLSVSKLRRELNRTLSAVGKKGVFTTFVGEGLYVLGTLCSLMALSLVDAALASAFFGLQPFYVFFYILILSLFLPRILNEPKSKQIILLKIFAIALTFAGTWLVI